MKKQILTLSLIILPSLVFAKVSDFDALISENSKAQHELHSNVKENLKEARKANELSKLRERIVVVENSGVSYNSPTNKDLLSSNKEKISHRPSEQKQFERLATEMSSLEE